MKERLFMDQTGVVIDFGGSGVTQPAADQIPSAPRFALFGAQAVAIATLFGSPAAGATLIAMNYRRLGKMGAAALTLMAGLGVALLALLIETATPKIVAWPIAVGLFFATRAAAVSLQGKTVERHLNEGGSLASKWAAFGISMAYLCVIFLTVFMPLYASESGLK